VCLSCNKFSPIKADWQEVDKEITNFFIRWIFILKVYRLANSGYSNFLLCKQPARVELVFAVKDDKKIWEKNGVKVD
jgi:hypothetical protein